jgi:4a-hydroxytetrahydrobiopterin dehydratase
MWQEENNTLAREFTFNDFKAALSFVNRVGDLAEEHNHHPDIELGWGRVKVILTTHSEGKVTDKDRQLAQAIDTLEASAKN